MIIVLPSSKNEFNGAFYSNSVATGNFENFIAAVRSRKHTDLHADIEEGHLSAALCHTANISYLLGRKMLPDKLKQEVRGNADLAEALGRLEQHLAANQVDLLKTPATWGAVLKVDAKQERFVGNSAANRLLTRNYRKPFVVPNRV